MNEEDVRRIVREEIQAALERLGAEAAHFYGSDIKEAAARAVEVLADDTLLGIQACWAGLDPEDVRRTHESPNGEMRCLTPECNTHFYDDMNGGIWQHPGTEQDCAMPECNDPFKEN